MSDTTIVNYLKAVGSFKLPPNIDTPRTEINYLHGTKMAEMYAKMVQRGIKDINEVPAAFREEVKRILGMNDEDAE